MKTIHNFSLDNTNHRSINLVHVQPEKKMFLLHLMSLLNSVRGGTVKDSFIGLGST